MNKLLLFIFCFFSFSIGIKAQNGCGTDSRHSLPISHEQVEEYSRKLAQTRLEADTIYLPLQIHIIKSSTGLQADEPAILQSIKVVNNRFRPLGMQFVVCKSFHYIQSDELSSLDNASESDQLITAYNNAQTIDIFYVNDVTYWNVCGFASVGWSVDGYIVMKKGCENNGSLEHEMGHYFNLMHTHETAYGAELVNGSNCATAGDLICDTPADPNLQYEVLAYNCKYGNTTLRDANGELYKPLEDNIMSYASGACTKGFTPQQVARMRLFYDQVVVNKYSCTDKVDFSVSLLFDAADFKKGQNNELRMVVQNTSANTYTGGLSYTIYLEDVGGNKTSLKAGSLSRAYSATMRDTVSFLVYVPTSLPDNTYQLTAVVDADQLIDESNENNNVYTKQVGLFANGGLLPDLIVTYTGPSTHYTGVLLQVQLEYKNIGNATSSYFTEDVFISEDDRLDMQDLRLGNDWVGSLAANEKATQTIQTGVPMAKPGYIIACADALNNVEELNDNNNCVITKIDNVSPPTNNPKPDYAITGYQYVGVVNNQLMQLDEVNIKLTIVNNGAQLDDSHLLTGFYFSKDQNLSSDDIFMDYGMGGNGTQMKFTIPFSPPRGGYYIIAKVDFKDYLAESNENNNVYAWRVDLASYIGSDMQLSNVTLSDYAWTENKSISIKGDVKNVGTYESNAWRINVYIRKDSLRFKLPIHPSLEPTLFSPWDSTFLTIGQQKSKAHSFHIGKQLAPGKYFVATCVSQPDGWREEYEDNCFMFDKPIVINSSLVTDLEEEESAHGSTFQLFPNPSHAEVVVLGEEVNEVSLISPQGTVIQKRIAANRFDVSGLAAGLYTVRLSNHSRSVFRKLIVQ